MPSIALATYAKLPDLVPDDRLLLDELVARGHSAKPAVWDDPAVDWAHFDAVVVRSCWDYHLKPQAFWAWLQRLEQLGLSLWNPPAVLGWNMDKTYLADLEALGFAIPPAIWLPGGAKANLADLLASKGWVRAVVKPTISASAHQTCLVTAEGAAGQQQDFEQLLGHSGVMVQEFVEGVQAPGEWSLMFFGGRYSHAVLKRPKQGDFRVQEEYGGSSLAAEPPPGLVEQAQALVGSLETQLAYTRVDGVAVDGQLLLMELELIEPYLFLSLSPLAAGLFAEAVIAGLAE